MLLAAAVLSVPAVVAPLGAKTSTTFRGSYTISIGTVVIGHAKAESRFTGDAYTAKISGSTGGMSRLVSDASAEMSGTGRINGRSIEPATFNLETKERGFATYVSMAMDRGRLTSLVAVPSLSEAADRIPVTARHTRDVVDPLSAFLIPVASGGIQAGRAACDRTIRVFDGWTRFDVELHYKGVKAVDGGSDTYAGPIIVCGARYLPVAGHRESSNTLDDVLDQVRLEVWLAPIEDTRLLVPFRFLVGTPWGDLVVHATRFTTQTT